MSGHLYIKPQNGDEFDLTQVIPEVSMLSLTNSSPQITPTYLKLAGSDGERIQNVAFDANTVTANVLVRAQNAAEFKLIAGSIYRLLMGRETVRLRDDIEPNKCSYVIPKPFEITPAEGSHENVLAIPFDNPTGFRYSLAPSDQLDSTTDGLGFGMNLPDTDTPYTFTTSNFNVYNPSDIAIDPYINHHLLKITVQGTGSFTLTNTTNGTSIQVTHSLVTGDTFVLDGVRSYLNGNADGLETDFGHIQLEKGNNEIAITGLSNPNITFSFPFIYF